MATTGDTVWMITGHSESGDEFHRVMAREPDKDALLRIAQRVGDDSGIAGLVTPADLDEDGFLTDTAAFESPDRGIEAGPGYAGSYVHLSVEKTVVI